MANINESFFSIAFDLIITDRPTLYDLYVNASIIEQKEKFVRIFPRGELLSFPDLQDFKQKYRQLYVPESQRTFYLQSLLSVSGKTEEEKAIVLKDNAIHYLDKLFDPSKEFTTEVLSETIVGCREIVSNMVDVLHGYNIDDLRDMIGKLSFHDFYTYDHSINVSMYCILIYQYLKPEAEREEIVNAGLSGLLHDLGKIKIPTHIINKPGKLTDEEFAEIKKHPDYGKNYIDGADLSLPPNINLDLISRVVNEHHENFDGTGYPHKIAGPNIHLMARVTAIADFFDAITTKRSYHKPLSTQDALALMKGTAGKKIDPNLFDLFTRHTEFFERNKISPVKLADEFDPCQPHDHLPLLKADTREMLEAAKKQTEFGKIKVVGGQEIKEWAEQKGVKVIETPKKKTG